MNVSPSVDNDPPDLPFGATLRRLHGLWRVEWRLATFAASCALGVTLLSLAIPVLVQRTIDDAVLPGDRSLLVQLLAAILGLAVVRFVVNSARRTATAQVGVRSEARLRELLYAAYLRFPRSFYDRHATGQVVSRATNDLYPIRYFIGWGVIQTAMSAMMIVGVGAILLAVDPFLTLCAALPLPLIAVLTWRFAHRVTPISRIVQQRKADVTEAADEAVVGIEMVQAFGREADVRRRFAERAASVRDGQLQEADVEARHLPALLFVPTLSIAVVLLVGGTRVIDGNLTLGEFVLFNSLLLQLAWPLEALGWIVNLGQRAIASAGRSYAWIEGIDPLSEPVDAAPLPPGPLAVSFREVHFRYGAGPEVLRGVDLEVDAGEIVAVCGPTGSGKSTLLGLVTRFGDPTGGAVRLGEVETRQARLADLRAAVALVTQRPVLFSLSLRDNLRAGNPDAPWSDVEAACRAAGVEAFVDDLPDGYDTVIGERGVNLSGGQRQRVALARALLSGARVLILDDPLSAVDTQTEHLLVENLRPAVRGRTVVLATQRLSTVTVADRAAVLLDGRIVEHGPPGELLEAGGPFAALFGDEVPVA